MAADNTLGKLAILILDPVEVDGFIAGKVFEAEFNPTEYGVERDTSFAEVAIPGLDAPVLQYVRGNGQRMNVELFFDMTDLMDHGVLPGPSVRDAFVAPLEKLMLQHPVLHAPPRVRLLWGATVVLSSAVATSLAVTYSLFDALGRPVRATARLGFRQHTSAASQLAEMALTSPDRTNVVTVREGDTLPAIAFREYGEPTEWRAIAQANGLSNPLALLPGTTLVVPRIS